jgi:PAS domain S-box-containing protein
VSEGDIMRRTKSQLVDEVSELRRRVEELVANDNRYRSLIEDQPDFISRYMPDGTLTFVNGAYARQHGFSPDGMIGRNIFEFVPPEEIDRVRSYLENFSPDQSFDRIENQVVMPDGALRWQEWTDRAFFDAAGRVAEVQAFGRDITERKMAEHELRGSEDRFSEAQRIGRIGSFEHHFVAQHFTNDVLLWSNETCRIFGLDPKKDTVTAELLISLMHPDDRKQTVETYDKAIAGEKKYSCDYRLLLPNDKIRYVHERGEVAFDSAGNPVRSFGTVQDITERKQSEEALADSEARLAEAQQLANVGSWSVFIEEGQQSETLFSAQLCRIFGIEPNSVPQGTDAYFASVHADDRERVKSAWDLAVRTDTPYEIEHRIVRPDGNIRSIFNKARSQPIQSPGGKVWHGVTSDITERKLAEEKLQQAQKMEAVGQLTGGVAHDFNNLLTVILGTLEFVRDRVAGDRTALEMIERGVKASERGAALTHRLLAFSRKQTLMPTTIDLASLTSGMSDMLRRTLGETIVIGIAATGGLWPCRADPAQLENALLNLAINARDAMPDGGQLTIKTENISLQDNHTGAPTDLESGNYVVLSVSDTGHGVSSETLAHVFEPFFTTKDVGKGSGLGLSMVYGFAKQSGGTATIDSAPGQGTTVRIYLPRAQS